MFHKSSFSSGGDNCVEVSQEDGIVLVRHSKRPADDILEFTDSEWDAFKRGVKAGEFD